MIRALGWKLEPWWPLSLWLSRLALDPGLRKPASDAACSPSVGCWIMELDRCVRAGYAHNRSNSRCRACFLSVPPVLWRPASFGFDDGSLEPICGVVSKVDTGSLDGGGSHPPVQTVRAISTKENGYATSLPASNGEDVGDSPRHHPWHVRHCCSQTARTANPSLVP